MQQSYFKTLFHNSFDTFKVFDNLNVNETGNTLSNAPKTIWQILNHLTAWQGHQLNQIKDIGQVTDIDEEATWVNAGNATNQDELNSEVVLFKEQLSQLKSGIEKFDIADNDIVLKLKLIQDLSVHLSFHIGEVILMRRMAGTYPLPHEMKAFLS
ncbi:hypothetical protein [Mucilaginibacter sp.]|jgi:hypothetical protein|uniref:hypothetical protein n=1 Tax=Mucilaginibacter sp. TaxID=1882438 RepID=UPI0035658F72